jgi:hypothetical protein
MIRMSKPSHQASNKSFNPDKADMGSTTFGNVTPPMTGSAMPATFNIGRAGVRRVRMDGRT